MAGYADLIPWVSPPAPPRRQEGSLPCEGTLNGVEMRTAVEGAHQRAWAHGKDGLHQLLRQALSLAVHRLGCSHDFVPDVDRCYGAPPGQHGGIDAIKEPTGRHLHLARPLPLFELRLPEPVPEGEMRQGHPDRPRGADRGGHLVVAQPGDTGLEPCPLSGVLSDIRSVHGCLLVSTSA